MSILQALVDRKVIKKSDIPTIEAESKDSGIPIEQILVARGVAPEEILKSKGSQLDVPIKSLKDIDIQSKVLEYIPQESAQHYKVIPIGVKDGVLEVGIVDPNDIEARDALNFISSRIGMPYKIFLITEQDFNLALDKYKGLTGQVTQALSDLEVEISESMPAEEKKEEGKGKMETIIIEDAPVTKIVATILTHATEGRASDIHIEPTHDSVRVRFRVDGELNTSLSLPIKVHSAVVARIKILSNMRLDEKRKPQDGRFSTKVSDRRIDLRVSTFPTYYGEKVVMRILDQTKGLKKLDDMGLSEVNLQTIRRNLKRPYGLILISGPTGSGKSTTLYSMLNEVDREHRNVLSLEDPVEYNMDGVSQSQIHPEIGYTFATGLRTTLRQDPDIIMVGEIRDKETAQLAIQAALTGHLVFSTIHTNNAIGVIPRLIDMGVDPYLIAPTLALTMAQRLVRTLSEDGGEPVPVEDSIKLMLEKQFADLPEAFRKQIPFGKEVYKIKPTPKYPSGTSGRIAVMEVLEMDKALEAVILKNPTEVEILKVARAKGMLTMKEDAIIKAFQKIIPFEEVNTL
ncbi:MAG: GspE/PulE family protein [bacterium]